MHRYKIFCTPEQTKKALELGAPIPKDTERFSPPIWGNGLIKPTAEEMRGWLETQEGIKSIVIDKTNVWQYVIWGDNGYAIFCNTNYNSRGEATLAAIDAALAYLSRNKEIKK